MLSSTGSQCKNSISSFSYEIEFLDLGLYMYFIIGLQSFSMLSRLIISVSYTHLTLPTKRIV